MSNETRPAAARNSGPAKCDGPGGVGGQQTAAGVYLEALLEAEVEERDHRATARRIQEARFPAVKTLEELDFQVVPHISVAVMRNLSEGGYLTDAFESATIVITTSQA